MVALYVEHDPFAAQWLTQLIARDLIAPGIVDSRDLEDIAPCELMGFTQVHLCAGIGIWSLALRRAGWPDDRPVWTASFPCQPFSAAGKGAGVADERHVWPSGHWLIDQCRPDVIFGEQVSSKDGLGWFDIVSADLEGSGYACGAYDLCAAGFGMEWAETQAGQWLRGAIHDCPDALVACALSDFAHWADAHLIDGGHHIRQRLYWLADANGAGSLPGAQSGIYRGESGAGTRYVELERSRDTGGLADTDQSGPQGRPVLSERADQRSVGADGMVGRLSDADHAEWGPDDTGRHEFDRSDAGRPQAAGDAQRRVATKRVGNTAQPTRERDTGSFSGTETEIDQSWVVDGRKPVGPQHADTGVDAWPASPYRPERPADWLLCTDGKWRSTRSGAQPLANAGTYRNRVGLLRGSGNALHADTAQAFIEAYLSR